MTLALCVAVLVIVAVLPEKGIDAERNYGVCRVHQIIGSSTSWYSRTIRHGT